MRNLASIVLRVIPLRRNAALPALLVPDDSMENLVYKQGEWLGRKQTEMWAHGCRAAVLLPLCDSTALLPGAGSCPCSLPASWQLGHGLQPAGPVPPGTVGSSFNPVELCCCLLHCSSQRSIVLMKTFSVLSSVTSADLLIYKWGGPFSRLQKLSHSLLPLTSEMLSFCISGLQSCILYSILYSSWLKASVLFVNKNWETVVIQQVRNNWFMPFL